MRMAPVRIPMDSTIIILSLALGGALCMIMVMVIWSLSAYFKRRIVPGQGGHGPVKPREIVQAERRQHQRVNVGLPVRMETASGAIEAETKSIGPSGAFICCQEPLPLGETFRLTIKPPDQDPLALNAQVVWSNTNVPDERILHRGMGIRFIRLTGDDREFLKRIGDKGERQAGEK